MHDHNLDDLIIDNIEPQNNKLKSLLTIIALMIVILIVAIILTRILLKTPQNNELVFEQQSEELIAPELKLQETPKQVEEKKEPLLSNIVESTKTEPVKEQVTVTKEEKSVTETKISEMKKEPVLSNITEEEIKAPEPIEKLSSAQKAAKDAEDIAYWESVQAKREAERKAKEKMAQKEKENIATLAPAETQKVKVPTVEKPKPVAEPVKKVVVQEPVQKPVTSQPKPQSTSTTKYYVQVGSFKTQPSSRIISVIKNNGYQYRILRSSTDGTKKLLIGPYADRAAVNRALVQIKDRINKRAFVVKR